MSGAALALAGCMTVDGPCRVKVDRNPAEADALVECESGGQAQIVGPGTVFDAARRAIEAAHAASTAAGEP